MNGRMVVYLHRLSAVVLLFCLVAPATGNAGQKANTSDTTFDWQSACGSLAIFWESNMDFA